MEPTEDDEGRSLAQSLVEGGPENEEDYEDAVARHAKYLGIDPEHDTDYMWIAEEVRRDQTGVRYV